MVHPTMDRSSGFNRYFDNLYQIFTQRGYDKTIRTYFIWDRIMDEKGDGPMSTTAKWIIGLVVAVIVLQFVAPFLWQLIFPGAFTGYGMMGRGYGYGMHMPMMGYGFGFFGMLFMWLIPLGLLILIVLGIAWLIKQLTTKPS
jgi:hypothetical protein